MAIVSGGLRDVLRGGAAAAREVLLEVEIGGGVDASLRNVGELSQSAVLAFVKERTRIVDVVESSGMADSRRRVNSRKAEYYSK